MANISGPCPGISLYCTGDGIGLEHSIIPNIGTMSSGCRHSVITDDEHFVINILDAVFFSLVIIICCIEFK